jgi:hypothetical protein
MNDPNRLARELDYVITSCGLSYYESVLLRKGAAMALDVALEQWKNFYNQLSNGRIEEEIDHEPNHSESTDVRESISRVGEGQH